jgi:cytochrome b561/polyisoprenoid-binding protein YceI
MHMMRYSKTAMILHWLLAAMIAFQYGLGEAFAHLPRGKLLFDTAQFHKSVGITILLLTFIRLAVRFTKPRPAPMGDHGWAERLASIVHWGLYAFMIGAPLTGWLATTTSKYDIPTYLFNAVPWPDFPFVAGMEAAAKHNLHEVAEVAHEVVAKLGLLLFLLHVVGALRHQWLLKEALIERMLPARQPLSAVVGSALIIALAGTAFALMQIGENPSVVPAANAKLMSAPDPGPAPLAPKAQGPTETKPLAVKPKDEPLKTEAAAEEKPLVDADSIPAGEAPRWTVAPGGQLGFTTSWLGTGVTGKFGSWRAVIAFNPQALEASIIKVTIDLATANSGDGERDTTLKGSDFFNIAAHPQAVWTSSRIRNLGGSKYRADGILSLRGVSRPVPLNFTLDINAKDARVTGSASLNRTNFGVGQGDYSKTDEIPDPVQINFNFRAKRN